MAQIKALNNDIAHWSNNFQSKKPWAALPCKERGNVWSAKLSLTRLRFTLVVLSCLRLSLVYDGLTGEWTLQYQTEVICEVFVLMRIFFTFYFRLSTT